MFPDPRIYLSITLLGPNFNIFHINFYRKDLARHSRQLKGPSLINVLLSIASYIKSQMRVRIEEKDPKERKRLLKDVANLRRSLEFFGIVHESTRIDN